MTSSVAAPAMMLRIRLPEAVSTRCEGVWMRSEAEFAALYQARFADLASQLYAYLGDRAEAQDVVQEAFVRAWQRWAKIGDYDDPVAWVRRVAWNLATSRHRRIAVVRRFVSRSRPPDHQPAANPDRVALVMALRQLPEKQRRALVLHYLADLSVAEIARDIGAAEGTVKSWLHRGRAELARQLSDGDTDGDTLDRGSGDGRTAPPRPVRSLIAARDGSEHAKASEEVNDDE
jgi:RNA polymerase sigma-70 factor (ECF subfamily)